VRFAAVAFGLLLVGCPATPPPTPAPRATSRPGNGWNVVLITIDTLRADHLGCYGYHRDTSPRIDALARRGTVFERAYTHWPKTRASMIILMTGLRPSQNGYSKEHPILHGFNPTLATTLKGAGYATAAAVDNPHVAAQHGHGRGFDSFRETWEENDLATEMDRTRAITESAVRFLKEARGERPFLLWLHYVNPHAPYTPPPPFDTRFLDAKARGGPGLAVVPGYHGGIPKQWAVPGRDRLGYYVAQYDGEIAAVDREVGQVLDALEASGHAGRTVVVLTSDHGESLGEHDYYFDHGEDLFEPSLAIPLIVAVPGGRAGTRSDALVSTLDVVPTILDAVKVSYPPDLAGTSLWPALTGGALPPRERLHGQNDRNLSATWDGRYKVVVTPTEQGSRFALYDRRTDPGELRDVSRSRPDDFRVQRRELELYLERANREWGVTRRRVGTPVIGKMSPEACEVLRALGYVDGCQP
jgi:arylsulfatase A-like enzyme